MTKATLAGAAFATVLVVLLAFVVGRRVFEQGEAPAAVISPAAISTSEAAYQGFIFGRITTTDGVIYEGRLRFGGNEEAFWSDYFNGLKNENPWAAHAPLAQLMERRPLEIFGVEVFHWERPLDLARPFMARFGDIARIEANGRDLWVTLKSGTRFHLDRFAADDFADGLRVWDGRRGVVDLDEWHIRTIDLLPTGRLDAAPDRLHGMVQTRGGDAFTGFIQWNREQDAGSDELSGNTADGALSLRFDAVRSIARNSPHSSLVTLLDGKGMVLSDTGNRGVFVDDSRYGRVLVSWDAFERVDFSPGGSGPAYDDFPPGRMLTGDVTTRDGRRIAGRLVYDLDESETSETLDAPSQGVDHVILFDLIASIVLPAPEERSAGRARVTLHSGEELQLELAGDLGAGNAGMLIFAGDGRQQPDYVRWIEIAQIHFDRSASTTETGVESGKTGFRR